jgi:golgi-specific brefeldin A-resistance guanine nucleotide exchange factor 1
LQPGKYQFFLRDFNPLIALQEHSFVRGPVIFHTISSFNQSTLERSASSILRGLALCIKSPTPLRNETTNTPDFWSILHSLHATSEGAATVFELLENIVTARSSIVTADNYEAAVSLLNKFATAGSIGAIEEQRYEKITRRSKNSKAAKPS